MRLREPRDLLGAVPYLVGYHPARSVVAVGLRGSRLHVTLRADLPEDVDDLLTIVDHLSDTFVAREIDAAFVLVYGDAGRAAPVLGAVGPALHRIGVVLLEALRVESGRYWSYLCRDPRCCPPEGTPYDTTSSRVAAEATLAGWLALPDRAAYESQVAPVAERERVGMAPATHRAHERLVGIIANAPDEGAARRAMVDAGVRAIEDALAAQRDGRRLADDAIAWLSVVVSSREVFEVAWGRIGERATLPMHRAVWLDVLRRAEPDLVAAPGALFALAAWHRGELTLARLALARVLDEEPTFGIAVAMDRALAHGSPLNSPRERGPSTVDRPTAPSAGPHRRRRSSSRPAGSRPA